MSALEKYRYELTRIGKEMQPGDWNEGASTIAEFADAAIIELETENETLRAERDNVPNVVALMKRAEQAEDRFAIEHKEGMQFVRKVAELEAENGRLRDDLTICRGTDVAQLAVVMHDRAEKAEAENAALKKITDRPPHKLDPFLRAEKAEAELAELKEDRDFQRAMLIEASFMRDHEKWQYQDSWLDAVARKTLKNWTKKEPE